MSNDEHISKLKVGVASWNEWRRQNPEIIPELGGADLTRMDLSRADLRFADLSRSVLIKSKLLWANLAGANLYEAHLNWAELRRANLSEVNLGGADLSGADLTDAYLCATNLKAATLVNTCLKGATLAGCYVYGMSAWNVNVEGAAQFDLVITPAKEDTIRVDSLEIAQFLYLLLNNKKLKTVIETITSKVVLILGRFTPQRKVILDALRTELHRRDYVPVMFDFERPRSQTTVETVSTLARLARFVIADLTDAKSVLQELQAIVPSSPSVPVQMLVHSSQDEPGMLDFIHMYQSVLDTHRYTDEHILLGELNERVIAPAEAKSKELMLKRLK